MNEIRPNYEAGFEAVAAACEKMLAGWILVEWRKDCGGDGKTYWSRPIKSGT